MHTNVWFVKPCNIVVNHLTCKWFLTLVNTVWCLLFKNVLKYLYVLVSTGILYILVCFSIHKYFVSIAHMFGCCACS